MADNEVKAKQDSAEHPPQKNEATQLVFFLAILVMVIFWGVQHPAAALRVLLVLLGFGGIVMIHELGHFIVAKLGKIKVEAFSIGFPPVILGIRKLKKGWRVRFLPKAGDTEQVQEGDNETEYQVGLFPIGGFVKMLGQSDTGAAEAIDDPRSYANRPVSIRIATVSAGVIFNAIGAIILFMILFTNGIDLPPAIVGNVVGNSPAYDAGLKPGDEIIEVNGDRFVDFAAVQLAPALSSPGESISFVVRRLDGTKGKIKVVAEKPAEDATQLRYSGISQAGTLIINPKIADDPQAVADLFEKTGLRPGDEIKAVNDQTVQYSWDYDKILSHTFQPEVTLRVARQWPQDSDSNQKTIEAVHLPMFIPLAVENFRDEYDLAHFGTLVPRLKVEHIAEPSKIERAMNWIWTVVLRKPALPSVKDVLQAGDILLKIADVEYPNYRQLREITTAHKNKNLPITVLRKDEQGAENPVEVTVTPKARFGSKRVMIGFNPSLDVEHPIAAQILSTPGISGNVQQIPSGATIKTAAGQPVNNFYDIAALLQKNAGQEISIDYQSGEETSAVSLKIPPYEPVHAQASLALALPFLENTRPYKASNPIEATQMGFKKVWQFICQNYITLIQLIKGDLPSSALMGPVGIITVSYQAAGYSLDRYLYLMGLISTCLAVMNLLPLPVLDGGHIVFLLIEKMTGKPIHERVLAPIMYVGIALLLGLFLWVTFHDVSRLLSGS